MNCAAVVVGDLVHGWFYFVKQAGELVQMDIVHRAFDGSAMGMTDDRDQFRARNFAGEFHAAQNVIIHYIAGDACAENGTDALVQDQLDGLTRIHTAQNHGKWILTRSGGFDIG